MKITVVGGSRGTGAELARQALAAEHEVTVVSRSGSGPEGARALAADASSAASLSEALRGADAVVVTVGAARGTKKQRAAVTRAVVEAMAAAGARRLVVQSSAGAGESAKHLPTALRGLMRLALASAIKDHEEQEDVARGSGLAWTLVRPSGLTDRPATGEWRVFEEKETGTVRGTIPRADLAAFMLGLLADESAVGRSFSISS